MLFTSPVSHAALFTYLWFITAMPVPRNTYRMDRVVNNEMERMRMEAVVPIFEVVFQHLLAKMRLRKSSANKYGLFGPGGGNLLTKNVLFPHPLTP